MRTESVIINMIRDNNVKKYVEVGVEYGVTLVKVLSELDSELDEYWAIDPWKPVGMKYGGKLGYRTPLEWYEMYASICAKMAEFRSLKVVKLPSTYIASLLPDEYFDMVYIDGDHCYQAVYDDLCAWYPKIKMGGVISGHDWNIRSVRDALRDFFGAPINCVEDNEKIWLTIKGDLKPIPREEKERRDKENKEKKREERKLEEQKKEKQKKEENK